MSKYTETIYSVLTRLNLLIHCYALQTFLAVLTLSSLQAQAEFKKNGGTQERKYQKKKALYTTCR